MGLGYEASDSANTRPNFRDNKIDADLLPRLTADDLKDIGVSARWRPATAARRDRGIGRRKASCGRHCFPTSLRRPKIPRSRPNAARSR